MGLYVIADCIRGKKFEYGMILIRNGLSMIHRPNLIQISPKFGRIQIQTKFTGNAIRLNPVTLILTNAKAEHLILVGPHSSAYS